VKLEFEEKKRIEEERKRKQLEEKKAARKALYASLAAPFTNFRKQLEEKKAARKALYASLAAPFTNFLPISIRAFLIACLILAGLTVTASLLFCISGVFLELASYVSFLASL